MTTTILNSFDEFDRLVDSVVSAAQNATFEEPLRETAKELGAKHQAGFDARQSPDGRPWPEWQWRSLDAPEQHQTLEVSGRLRRSLLDGPDHVEDVGSRSLVFGTRVPYAGIHNAGATIRTEIPLVSHGGRYLPAGSILNIPQREHVGMTTATLDGIANRIADSVVDQMRSA